MVSIPTSAELRKEFETGFQKAFPVIELELSVARGASNINKIVEEQSAGVRTIDLHIGGTTSIVTGLLAQNLLDPVMPARHPDAGFYLWARVPGGDDAAFARDLFAATHVTELPGQHLARDAQGVNPGRGYVRIALVPEKGECVEAARRIVEFCR